ncbi:hypothetical protein [Massilia aquatica]|uniref:Uncharacterized protein n=1 Tax=Massilia aquatica TaxID=2609000 RepID=A0ABX0M0F1_9BURK|nr:hypothetical protein [Massilia aquatica]NHZ40317.1 hypothetical protein [Massilia aquatica]
MAYDLVVGPGSEHGAAPDCAASIDFHDLPALAHLKQRARRGGECDFLERISHLCEDQAFDHGEVERALATLLPLLRAGLHPDERALLLKLTGVLSFASRTQQGVHGICD